MRRAHKIGERLVSLAPGWPKSGVDSRSLADDSSPKARNVAEESPSRISLKATTRDQSPTKMPAKATAQDLETSSCGGDSVSLQQPQSRVEVTPTQVHRAPLQVVFQSSEVFVSLPHRQHVSGTTTPATATSSGNNTDPSSCSRIRQQQQQQQPQQQQLHAHCHDNSSLESWRPCELTLTEDALQISSKAYDGGSNPLDAGLCPRPSANDLLPCWIELQQIVDVASSVCVFGSVVKELDATPKRKQIPASNVTMRATESKFANILRTMPQEELRSMLVEVAPYEYKEMASKPGLADGYNDSKAVELPKQLLGTLTGTKDIIVEDDEEWLSNGVALGTFELPPIPLARLPETRSGLPKVTNHPGMQGALPPKAFPGTFGGMPVGEYDSSNCRPHHHVETSIPPLPPCACRLPQRTHRDLLENVMSTAALLESNETPYAHYIVVWTTASTHLARCSGKTRRLQQGDPVLLSFRRQEEAQAAYNIMLEYRARQTIA